MFVFPCCTETTLLLNKLSIIQTQSLHGQIIEFALYFCGQSVILTMYDLHPQLAYNRKFAFSNI